MHADNVVYKSLKRCDEDESKFITYILMLSRNDKLH